MTFLEDSRDPRFIGYYISLTETERLKAGKGKEWRTSGTLAGDCLMTDKSCSYVTMCTANTEYYDNGRSSACSEEASCVQLTILQTSPDGWPVATNIRCRRNWSAFTMYRQLDTITSSTSTITSLVCSPASTSMTPNSTPSSNLVSTEPSSSITPTLPLPGPQDANKQPHRGGISTQGAAAAIGMLAGLLLLAGAAWFILRRRKKRAIFESAGPVKVAPIGRTKYNNYPELDSQMRPAELGSMPPRPRAELW